MRPCNTGAHGGYNAHAGARIFALELAAQYTRDGRYRWVAHRLMNFGQARGFSSTHRHIQALSLEDIALASLVCIMDIPGTLNTMIFATKQTTKAEDFAGNLVALSRDPGVHPLLISAMQVTFANLKPSHETTTIFTDDRAPIEWIVNDMVIRFVLGGKLEYIQ